MVTINRALAQVKRELASRLSSKAILEKCRQIGHCWRESPLDPAITVYLFAMQILAGNTACNHLRLLSGLDFTASAYCQARQRLPLEVIRDLARQVGRQLADANQPLSLWHGHRVFLVDGAGCSMPDTAALQKEFGQPAGQKEGCGFPVVSTLIMVHAYSGAIMDMLLRPLYVHDMSGVARLHADLRPGDVLIGDRAFSSYAHLGLLQQRGLHGIFRIHQRTIVSFRPRRRHARLWPKKQRQGKPTSRWIKRLGRNDQLVEYFKPKPKPAWMSQEQFDSLPPSLLVREVRWRIRRRGFRVQEVTLMTTLVDSQLYPACELAEQFLRRWSIEGDIDHLKTTMGAAVLHCKSVSGVTKELWAFALVYNLVRQVMIEAARRQNVDPARISFVDALRWLASVGPGSTLQDLVVNPHRPGRCQPRVVKRRMKPYPLMTKPRALLKQEMDNKRVAA